MTKIHPNAIIHPEAELAADVEVGAYSIVGARVILGEGTRLLEHVIVHGPTALGRANVVYPFAVLGTEAQHKMRGELAGTTRLVIGDRNEIREHVTIHQSSQSGETRVGDDNLLMVNLVISKEHGRIRLAACR
jgi:UDP-N-acetylglucosamine acyltransferase